MTVYYDISNSQPKKIEMSENGMTTACMWYCGRCNAVISSSGGPGKPHIICESCAEFIIHETGQG